MNCTPLYPSREDQAKAEIGHTAITRRSALALVSLLLAMIIIVPSIDQAKGGLRAWRALKDTENLRASLRQFETTLADSSTVGRFIRPRLQRFVGTENVYKGRDGWLFYAPDVRYVTGRGFLDTSRNDPVAAILDFKRQLDARGIALVIVPTPLKPMTRPEQLWPSAHPPLNNRAFDRFKLELQNKGISVYDFRNERPIEFLKTDTHWRPETMETSARDFAEFVEREVTLPQSLGLEYRQVEKRVSNQGDLAKLLESGDMEHVTIHQVREPTGQAWSSHHDAEILWLGDSFSNIYSAEAMGWGSAAGFAEQFSFALGRPLDALRRNDDGAFATRQILADELGRGNDRLAGKKLVIWQFADRELSLGDWKRIELRFNPRPVSSFIVPPPGESWIVTGTVFAKGVVPRPGNVAYRDHVMAIHLRDIRSQDAAVENGQAVVYLRSMIDGKLTDAAALQIGQRIKLKLRDWSEVSRQYEFIHRSDLPDEDLRGQPPCWGELVP